MRHCHICRYHRKLLTEVSTHLCAFMVRVQSIVDIPVQVFRRKCEALFLFEA